jgi:hypothetical protein
MVRRAVQVFAVALFLAWMIGLGWLFLRASKVGL